MHQIFQVILLQVIQLYRRQILNEHLIAAAEAAIHDSSY